MSDIEEDLKGGLDPAAFRRSIIGANMAQYQACLCRKLVPLAGNLKKWYSGVVGGGKIIEPGINYTAVLCDDCVKTFADQSRIVCLKCKSLMGFYKPGRQSSGFVFEKGKHYHIEDCPRCTPERKSTPVLEHDRFCKARGIPTRRELDLLQEIEQKRLQSERATAKLREELADTAGS